MMFFHKKNSRKEIGELRSEVEKSNEGIRRMEESLSLERETRYAASTSSLNSFISGQHDQPLQNSDVMTSAKMTRATEGENSHYERILNKLEQLTKVYGMLLFCGV